jgi:hypothetical protein
MRASCPAGDLERGAGARNTRAAATQTRTTRLLLDTEFMRYLLAVVLISTGCGRVEGLAAPTAASSSPTLATSSPSINRTFAIDAGAAWPRVVVYGGTYGGVVQRFAGGTTTDLGRVCELTQGLMVPQTHMEGVIALSGEAIVFCSGDAPDKGAVYRFSDTGAIAPVATGGPVFGGATSPDAMQLAAFKPGDCPMPAPVCQTRAVLIELATGLEREILPSGYYLGATLGWTSLGLTYFQPSCADAGCSGLGDKGGTFVWNGSAFLRESPLRFIAAAGSYRVFERAESLNELSQRSVVLVDASGEHELTPAGQRERALSIGRGGEVLAWRVGTGGHGILLRYDAGGRVLWQAAVEGQAPIAIGPDVVMAATYTMLGTPTLVLYDASRMLRFQVPLTDLRVWSAIAQ